MTTTPAQSSLIHSTACVSTFMERQQEKFPLNTFFSLQTFRLYHGTVDFIGGVLEWPLSLLQL